MILLNDAERIKDIKKLTFYYSLHDYGTAEKKYEASNLKEFKTVQIGKLGQDFALKVVLDIPLACRVIVIELDCENHFRHSQCRTCKLQKYIIFK